MPNTKTKKFDFQIFLAVIMILLVICCSVVCIFADEPLKGVARAEGEVPNSLTNLTFETTENFYIKNLTSATNDEIKSYINYFTTGIDGVFSNSVDFTYYLEVGTYVLTYDNANTIIDRLQFEISQISSYGIITLSCKIMNGSSSRSMFDIMYMYTSGSEAFQFTTFQSSSSDDLNYIYNVPNLSSLDWFAVFGITPTSVNKIKFNFNYTTNLGCLVSPNGVYATVPSFGGYDEGYQDAVNVLQPQIDTLTQEKIDLQNEITRLNGIIESKDNTIDYYEALLPALSKVPIFDISKCTPSTFTYNGYTYSSDTIEATDSGWNIYDSRYNNKEIPSNYGVGFSFFLPDTYSSTQYQVSPFIECYLNSPTQVAKLLGFSIGYRTQNGEIVKIGDYSNSPGFGTAEFIINPPTRELVFFEEDCNRMEMKKHMSVDIYEVYTQVLYDEAYSEGYKTGYGYGKYVGKNEGIEQASDYSFFSLFSAVFDAPITAIVGRWGDSDGDGVYEREGGMLNFYIPGLDINFAPFLLSIFTLAIIVMIIRFILARKS